MSEKDLAKLENIRQRLFNAIAIALAEGGHCKSYEGTFGILLPNYFEQRDDAVVYTVTLDCYVIGPSRHYEWTARTLAGCLEKADVDISRWINEWNKGRE